MRISSKSSKRRITSSRTATSATAAEPCELQAPATVLSLVNTLCTVAQKTASAIFNFLTMPGHDGTTFDKRLRMGAAAVPLFASTGMNNTLPLITSAVASFIRLYLLLLFVRVLLTWFPNVNWMGQPWITLRQVTDPYLNLFRNLIPPIMGQIDFTPILGFLVLQFLAQVLGTDDIYSTF
ncbi:hypothetical protein CYMTET_20363 [Cymbomonas tetramitiformis]|uniref:Uncharacterized protein n=1 Tax=Cymbomonas tetramitiformis TaxID=36881 RepID=A0AAE0G475_9CHLO|nr:hypothetical protein CYMTET_20363 [Cymbomonas tetramitiformis]